MTLTDNNAHWTKSADTVAVVSLISVISTQSTQRCLGYPSIRSPAAILSWVSIDRYTVFTQSVSPQSHESPPVQLSLSDARSHSVSVRVTCKPGTLREGSLGLKSVVWNFRNFFFDSCPAETVSWVSEILLFVVYESYEISRYRNQNLETTTQSEILSQSPNSHHETFARFLAVLGFSKILAILEGSDEIFPRKRSLARCPCYNYCGYPRSWES